MEMSNHKRKTRWAKVRKLFNDLHLWMGLTSGLFVIVICFSGTVYVFNTELREMAAPHLYKLGDIPDQAPLDAEEIIGRVEAHTGGTVQSLKIPADRARTWQVSVKAADESAPQRGGRRFGTVYAVNPY